MQIDRFILTRERLSRWNRGLSSWPAQIMVASVIAAGYCYAYLFYPGRPGATDADPIGWWAWWDQSQYLKCAAALAGGSLTPDSYWYPLGYPALGALFYRFIPQHPFLIPDVILVVGAAMLFYRLAAKFVSSIEALLLLIVFTACYRGTAGLSLIEPWNTIPVTFLAYLIIFLVIGRDPGRSVVLWSSLCVGLIYLCRPPDAVCLALVLPFIVLRIPKGWNHRIITGAAGILIIAVFVGAVFAINHAVFGTWRTPYEVSSARIGFGSYPLTQKAFWLLLDAQPLFRLGDTALLRHFPWLVLLPPGIVYFIHTAKWTAVATLSAMLATFLVYFAYNDLWPGNIFRYHLVHYLFWTFPLLALLTYVGLTRAWRCRVGRWSMALILPLLLCVCLLGLKERVSGRVPRESLADAKSVPSDGSRLDWIFWEGGVPKSDAFGSELGFRAFQDFVTIGREGGYVMLLSKTTRHLSLNLVDSEARDWKAITYGTLNWGLQWPPRGLEQLTLRLSSSTQVTLRGTIDGVDTGGPRGESDGRADEVIWVDVGRAVWQRIAGWDIQTTDGRGHWVTEENSRGWWLIKANSAPSPNKTRVRVTLSFPDYGDFANARAFTLRAHDADGNLVCEEKVSK